MIVCGRATQPLLVIDGWRAAHDLARLNVTVRSGLGCDNHAVTNLAMARNSSLSGKDYVVSDHS
jgi:hypothetical protein